MFSKRISLSLAVGVLLLLISPPASAQIEDMQLFAPAEFNEFGIGPVPHEGFYFTFDALLWSIESPEVAVIGNPDVPSRNYNVTDVITATQGNSADTSNFNWEFVSGQKYGFGYVCDRRGVTANVWRLNTQDQKATLNDVSINFDDRVWGDTGVPHLVGPLSVGGALLPLPVLFDTVSIRNRVQTWGAEVNYMLRSRPLHHGGYFELFGGVRYLEFNDRFKFDGYQGVQILEDRDDILVAQAGEEDADDDIDRLIILGDPGILDDTMLQQDANNHIVGPQIGARWFKQRGRFRLSTEGRFFAGFNSQNNKQFGVIGTKLDPAAQVLGQPAAMGPTQFNHSYNTNEFTPGFELGIDLEWQWTKAVSFRLSWTGLWLDNIARASNMIDWTLYENSVMGIMEDQNTQGVFINGISGGIMFNY